MFESFLLVDKVSVTFFVVIVVSFYFLLKKSQTFSSYKLFYIFVLIFLGVAPWNYYLDNVSLLGARPLTPNEYYTQNIAIIILLLAFNILYKFFINRINWVNQPIQNYKAVDLFYFLFIALVFLLNKILVFKNFSVTNFWIRGGSTVLDNVPTPVVSIVVLLVYTLPLVFFGHLYILWRGKLNISRIVILSLLLLVGFPTALSRTSAAVILTPLLFYIIPSLVKKNNFVYFFIAGFVYFFPFLDQFRRISSLQELKFGIDFTVFETAHFDSYYNAALIINELPLQYGNQLLGAVLFFVPRFLWPEKPIGTGALMAQHLNMSFENLSANYFAEGYVNFGLLGVAGFLVILSFILAFLDRLLKHALKYNQTHLYVIFQLIFSTFYLLRGDLISSFALITSILIMNTIVIKTFNIKRK